MTAVAAISSVETRIAAIRRQLAPTAGPLVDPASAAPDISGFDPFGATYQAALEAVQQSPVQMGGASTQQAGAFGLESMTGTGTGAVRIAGPTTSSSPIGAPAVGGVAGASIGRIGGYGSIPVPPELAAYGNGRVPSTALVPIGQGGHRLFGPAAEAWKSAVEAAAADGVSLRITDSYRSYAEQVDLAERKGLYSEGGWAATPGTSNHGWGLAVDADVSDPATLTWIRANGWRFGFVEAVPREPWHWEYRPSQA